MRELNTIQEKILDRALFLISQKGGYDVPVRDITSAAGVNVNAINYYFGSKDNMINQMEEFFIENYLSAYSILDEAMDNEEKLLLWANEIMEYILQYPRVQIIFNKNLKSKRNGKIKKFFAEKADLLSEKIDQLLKAVFNVDGENLKLVRILFDSAVIYPASFGTGCEFDMSQIRDKNFRLQYLSFVIHMLKEGIVSHEI